MNPIQIDPEIMHGTPCFTGTRVPVKNLIDVLERGKSIEDFLAGYPTVTREQVQGVLELSKEKLLAEYEIAA